MGSRTGVAVRRIPHAGHRPGSARVRRQPVGRLGETTHGRVKAELAWLADAMVGWL